MMKYKVGDWVVFNQDCRLAFSCIPKGNTGEITDIVDTGLAIHYRIKMKDYPNATVPTEKADEVCTKIKPKNDKHNILNGLLNSDGSVDGEKLIEKLEENQVQVANGVVMNDRPQRPTTPASTGQEKKIKVGDNVQFVRTLSFPNGGYIKKGTVWEIVALNDTRYTILLVDGEEGVKGIGYNINSSINTINSYCEKVEESDSEECFGTPEGEANEITNNGNTIRPGYYQSSMGDVFDIANEYGLDMPLGTAVKYILRAGKKDKEKEIEDLEKAIRSIERAIEIRRDQH